MNTVPPNKAKEAVDLDDAVNEFLRNGGQIKVIPTGRTAIVPVGTRAGALVDLQTDMADIEAHLASEFAGKTTND